MDTQLPPPIERPRVAGHLYATCAQDATGKCILSRKDFKTPIHISKPYWDGHSLLLNLMCPTAGMLAGDSAELEVKVETGASLTLSNPSSLRIHKMDPKSEASWTQSFTVAKKAFLENNPEWLILQGESAFTQRTTIDLTAGAELFFIEAIAPGRIAHQEAFSFRQFRNRLSLRYDGKLALLEKHCIEPKYGTATAWKSELGAAHPFYVSILLASAKLDEDKQFWREIHELQCHGIKIGASQLAHSQCWCIKILAADPIAARRAVTEVRQRFYEKIGRRPSSLRR
ncbi:urease accessory protein UreD [Pelagicoccus sp. SDUM812002]|uniref:urease accessory protein UreD n=1 Tax=Pelagicoccus sp. SDUM812002 TaxID=3041266 RepID=UPI00280D6B3B|nr:urease accessory protein UreD [Pelagicoccus sp. SDUM812002]MDQ8186128.1 urease accessory protein UreD [Pelagicoccus sp. SDUM812002]